MFKLNFNNFTHTKKKKKMVNRQLSLKFQPLWGLWPLSSSRDNTRTKRMYLKWQIRAGGYVPNHWRVDRHHKAWHRLPRSWSTWRERDETFTGCGTDRRTFTRSNRPSHGHSTHCLHTHALPGSIGQLEDDVIGQVVHFPQPEVVGDVVAVHERLKATTAGAHQLHTVSEN